MTYYFLVLKGEYIRMAYNGTPSGLKSSLWAPHFALPTFGLTLRAFDRGNFMADQEIGEMFLNFMLSEEVRSFCWVDITNMRT